jgi:hypothetical protein
MKKIAKRKRVLLPRRKELLGVEWSLLKRQKGQ